MVGNVSSRTPEGHPSRCPICGAQTRLDYSQPSGDAPCPGCGYLLWRSQVVLEKLVHFLEANLNATPGNINAQTKLRALGVDSLEIVEIIMELEEEFDASIPDEAAAGIQTLGDAVRFIEDHRQS